MKDRTSKTLGQEQELRRWQELLLVLGEGRSVFLPAVCAIILKPHSGPGAEEDLHKETRERGVL